MVFDDSPSPDSYYLDIADYNGCVKQIARELVGLTTESYVAWYYHNCFVFYSQSASWSASWRRLKKVNKSHDFDDQAVITFHLKLAQRRYRRLYILRSMQKIKQQTTQFLEHEYRVLNNPSKVGYRRACDKHLFSAYALKGAAEILQPVTKQLREARIGNSWFTNPQFSFNPECTLGDTPIQVAKIIAAIQHFQYCWQAFSGAEQDSQGVTVPSTIHPPVVVAESSTPITQSTLPDEMGNQDQTDSLDTILDADFEKEDIIELAREVGLVNQAGHFALGERKLSGVVGFCQALQIQGKVKGSIPTLTSVIGPLLHVTVLTRKTGTKPADKFFKATERKLANYIPIKKRLSPTK